MIGRIRQRRSKTEEVVEPKGFDDFELRLGDVMRGERATMGKSLLDVQRELRIKASYIAAIENSDPSVFDTPGFIAGYVRSYARYLNMDPDEAFATFCKESGFAVAHGMSDEASGQKKQAGGPIVASAPRDPFASPNTPFTPVNDGFFSHIEPRAIGSTLVLLALIGGIGYGGWSVLKEVQQVQFAPVEQTPTVLADLDPLDSATRQQDAPAAAEALDRLYRPQALDVPVLTARDAPISTLDPLNVGSFRSPSLPQIGGTAAPRTASLQESIEEAVALAVPQVVEEVSPNLVMVAVRTAWVRVTAADGTRIYEATMQPGDTFEVPLTKVPPTLRAGESGAIYFAMDGEHYGPLGGRGEVTRNFAMGKDLISEQFEVADLEKASNIELKRYVEATALTPQTGESAD